MPLDRCQEGRASQYASEEGAGCEQNLARRKASGHISMFEVRPEILGKSQCKRDMKRQSVKIRRQRLDKGCCPTHGLRMSQIDGWYQPASGRQYTIVGCPRKDCRIRAKAYDVDGPWELLGANEEPEGQRI